MTLRAKEHRRIIVAILRTINRQRQRIASARAKDSIASQPLQENSLASLSGRPVVNCECGAVASCCFKSASPAPPLSPNWTAFGPPLESGASPLHQHSPERPRFPLCSPIPPDIPLWTPRTRPLEERKAAAELQACMNDYVELRSLIIRKDLRPSPSQVPQLAILISHFSPRLPRFCIIRSTP